MRAVAAVATLLLLLGLWVRPHFTDAGPATEGTVDRLPVLMNALPATQPAAAATAGNLEAAPAIPPAERARQLVLTRGQEGFWRLGKDQHGVWWFIGPAGEAEFLNTVTTVHPYQRGRDITGPHYLSADWTGGMAPDGDVDRWAQRTLRRIREVGFKGIGAWSHMAFHRYDVPITRDLNISTWMTGSARRLYSPQWREAAEQAVKTQVEPLKDNRNLVGYYTDNELDWGDNGAGPGRYFDYLAPTDPNRQEVVKVIRSVWNTLEGFNKDWNTNLQSWEELDAWTTLPHEQTEAYGRLFSAWLSHLAEDYFRITSELVRKHDPNHLVLGVRFQGVAPVEVVRASRNYTDAQSLNYYVNDALLDYDMFSMMHEQSGQPVIISEYSFHSLDGRSGNRNTVGFAAQVLDQQARADGYRLFTTRLARVPYVVGADWFQWMDEPPSGRTSDGEDVNFGVVDVDDRAYELLAEAVRETTPKLNDLHARSHGDAGKGLWRESFADKPEMHVPHLDEPIRLNGELSDWPARAKLAGMRHSRTVGLERSPLPLPNVYLGWTYDGLYVGMEIFDNDIHGAPAKGWWWTRDCAELWVHTRRPADDLHYFDKHSHQFFFVPEIFPGDGSLGTVGQWHRNGDALSANLVPHPDVQDAVRILPDRYVVEMFIPAKALHGFEPTGQTEMAFNVGVRNFQHAIDYFWSAPKQLQTQYRPNTWGRLHLQPPVHNDAIANTNEP